jgi:hypothetical protein
MATQPTLISMSLADRNGYHGGCASLKKPLPTMKYHC